MQILQAPPYRFNLAAKSKKQPLVELRPYRAGQTGNYQISSKFVAGKLPQQGPNRGQIYLLPFDHGKQYPLAQGYFGKESHHSPTPYALDFAMPEGSRITAARAGIVAEVKQHSTIGGPNSAFQKFANYITVYHPEDNTLSLIHI